MSRLGYGAATLALVEAERDELRAEVERLRRLVLELYSPGGLIALERMREAEAERDELRAVLPSYPTVAECAACHDSVEDDAVLCDTCLDAW